MRFTTPLALLGLLALPYFIWLGWPRSTWARARSIAATFLRALIVILLVFGLAGLHVVKASDTLAVVFLIDASDSMPATAVEAARQYVASSIEEMRPQDQAAIVVFGSDALVERPMSAVREVGPLESDVLPLNTDLAEAIRLGMALYPPGAARRMVILSDGLVTAGDATQAARLAAAAGVEIFVIPFAEELGSEVLVTDVSLPGRLNEGQVFDLTVTIESSLETLVLLRVIDNETIAVEETVALVEGVNRFAFTLTAGETGLASYRVQVVPAGEDSFYQNNELSGFTQVVGPPRILLVSDDEAETVNLEAALLSQDLLVDRIDGISFPADLATLSGYQSVVMANIPARVLGPRKMELIQSYVRDLGGGLVVIGGPNAFGPGGYFQTPLEETLPVEMQLRDQERLPQLAVVYVIDRSGSMADYSPGGFGKLELAKEAVLRSIQLLGPLDRVGVVAFDTEASWVVPLGPADNREQIGSMVAGLRPGGGTDIYAGLLAVSRVFPDDPSNLRHIVLLTDGGAAEGGNRELVQQMYEEHGITLSVIAITAEGEQYGTFIADLPELAGGRFHHAYNVDTIPEIFTEETILATRAYIIENEFFPSLTSSSPILTGIEGTPSLLGYIGSSIKPVAQQILATDQDDPLLAAWQYGLGRAVAWTSDATGRWAQNWVIWDSYPRFWSQVIRWTITEGVNQNVEVQVIQEGEQFRILVDAIANDGSYLNDLELVASVVSPDLSATPLELQQVAPGRYEATFKPGEEGAYFVRIAGAGDEEQAAVAQTSGWVLAYSPEYRSFEGDPGYLAYIAELTGGIVVEDQRDIFAHTLDTRRSSQPVWPWLFLAATLLLPFDIAIRRLVISRSDWVQLAARLGLGRSQRTQAVLPRTSRVGSLLDVKDRVKLERRETYARISPTDRPETPEPAAPSPPEPASGPAPGRKAVETRSRAAQSTATSLLESKRRRQEEKDNTDG
nr:VWA domain-containing protein [Anaerolineae bacterium]